MNNDESHVYFICDLDGTDIFYTYSNWPIEEIDGEKFIPVVKQMPDPKKNQVVHYMKKDSMEYVK